MAAAAAPPLEHDPLSDFAWPLEVSMTMGSGLECIEADCEKPVWIKYAEDLGRLNGPLLCLRQALLQPVHAGPARAVGPPKILSSWPSAL